MVLGEKMEDFEGTVWMTLANFGAILTIFVGFADK